MMPGAGEFRRRDGDRTWSRSNRPGMTGRISRWAALYTTGVANVVVGVTGGIAAYKAPGVIRRLREAGYGVSVVATEAAFRFVPEETLSIAAGGAIHTDRTWWEHSG